VEDHAAFCTQGCCCLWLCLESMQMLCPCSELYCTLWEVLVTDRGPGLEQYLPLRRGDCCFSPKGELCWNWSWCPLVILSVVQLFLRFMPRGNEFAVFQRRMYHRDRYFGNSCHRITVFWGGRDMGNVFKTIFSFLFFTQTVVKHWNRLPKESVDAPSLQAFKARLDEALGNLIWWKVSLTGDTLRSLPTQTILWFYDSKGNSCSTPKSWKRGNASWDLHLVEKVTAMRNYVP